MKFWRWGSESLRQRFTIGIAARVVPLIVLTFGAISSLENAIVSFKKTENQTLESVFPLKRLEDLMFDASQPIEEYLNTGDARSRDRFLASSRGIDYTFEKLLESNRHEPENTALVLASQKSWRRLYRTGLQIFEHKYPIDKEITIREHKNLDAASRDTIESISRLYNFLYHVQRENNLEQVQKLEERVRAIAYLLLALELTLAAISGLVLYRSILVPLKKLEIGVSELSDGNLDHQINLKQSDELGQLAATLDLMACKLKQTQTELRDLAIKDGLTGLYNRREFNRRLSAEIERSQRYGHDCSLLMMDIDYFKKLNDTYGHQGGDEALRTVAALLQKEVRPVDIVARYGGEEFAAILPQTSQGSAMIVAERLRNAIALNLVLLSADKPIHITVSVGCATFPDDANTGESLISAADVALYTAKNSGRNRVISFQKL